MISGRPDSGQASWNYSLISLTWTLELAFFKEPDEDQEEVFRAVTGKTQEQEEEEEEDEPDETEGKFTRVEFYQFPWNN